MLSGWFTLLLIALPFQARNPATPQPRSERPRFQFQTFGQQTLQNSVVVAEARATSVILAGRGVTVAHFEVLELFRGKARERELVVLAAPDQFICCFWIASRPMAG